MNEFEGLGMWASDFREPRRTREGTAVITDEDNEDGDVSIPLVRHAEAVLSHPCSTR